MKKNLFLLLLLHCLALSLPAQIIKKPAASNNFSDSLSKIVHDFDGNFIHLQGAALPPQPDAEIYKSSTCLPAALHCIIYRYHSVQDKTASWQAIVYSGDNFDEAMKAYQNIYRQVKKTTVYGIAGKSAAFDGEMQKPDENVRFAVSSLRLKTTDAKFRQLAAEIELSNNYDGWEVRLNIFSKKYQAEKEKEKEEDE